MIKAVIIDDETSGIDTLRTLIERHLPDIQIIGTASTISSGKSLLAEEDPDLVFLDIEMPGGTGFDIIGKGELPFEVIITTAYSDHAVKAFRYNAADYLMKPIDKSELVAAVKKAEEKIQVKKVQEVRTRVTRAPLNRLAVPTNDGLTFIDIDDIIKCSAKDNYTELTLLSGQRLVVSRTLGQFEAMLEKFDFSRVHKSYLVNLQYVQKYFKAGYLTLTDGSIVEVSKRRRAEFVERFLLKAED